VNPQSERTLVNRDTTLKQSVPKRLHIKFRHRGITQKKAYNMFQGGLHVWKECDRGWFPTGTSGRHGWIEGLTYPFLAPSILPESGLE